MIVHISPERHLDTLINKVVAYINIPPHGNYSTSLIASTHTHNDGLGTDLYVFKVNYYECIGIFVNSVLTYLGITVKDRYEHIYLKSGFIRGE